MANDNNIDGKVGLDTTSFKKGVSELASQIKSIETNFRSSAAIMGSWSEKSDGLKLRVDALNDKLTLQKKTLSILTDEYNKAINAEQKDEKAIASLAEQMYKAEKAISSTERDIKKYNKQLDEMTDTQDEAKTSLKKMAEEAEASAKKMDKLGGTLKTVGDKAQHIGKGMTVGITTPIIAAGVASFKLGSDLDESMNKVDVAFKGSSASVEKWSDTSLEKFGLAKGTALDMTATYGDMATSMGFTTGEAAKLSKELVGRVADLASYKNESIDVANTALTGVFTGETESLKHLGIVMTEANLKQYMLAEGYTNTYDKLSQQEKIQLRINYVMDASKNAAGDYARTNKDAAGQVRTFKEGLKELGTTFGEVLVPMITPAIKSLNETIKSFSNLGEGSRKTVLAIAGVSAAMGPLIFGTGKVITTIGAAMQMLSKYKTASATAALAQATLGTTAITSAGAVTGFGVALKSALGPIALVVAAISALAISYKTTANKIEESKRKIIDQNYDKLLEKDTKKTQTQIANLEKEKTALSNNLNKKLESINSYYDKASEAAGSYEKNARKALEAENKAYSEAHKKRLAELEEEQKKRKEAIDEATGKATSEIQLKIDAIDNLTKAEDRAQKEKDNKQKIVELNEAVANAKTVEEKKQAQKNLDEFLAQLNREKILANRELQKQELQNQISVLQQQATSQKSAVDKEIENHKRAADANLKTQQQSVANRLNALDGYTENERKKLEESKANAIRIEQEKTNDLSAQIDRRIADYQELEAQVNRTIEAERKEQKENAKAGFGETVRGLFNKWADGAIVPLFDTNAYFGKGGGGSRAIGDDDWKGGPVRVNDFGGGEILNLPRHTQIIPHDISMEMARTYAKHSANSARQGQTTNNNYYGPAMQSTTLQVGAEKIATVVSPTVAETMFISQLRMSGGGGGGD